MHNLTLGDRVGIKHVHINAKAGVTIGNDCLIAAGVKIWSANHRFADPNIPIYAQDYDEAPVTIGDDVWVAANAIVLPGVEIGHGAVVGAGAVVTRNVAAFTVVAGVPAKAIGRRGPTGLAAMD